MLNNIELVVVSGRPQTRQAQPNHTGMRMWKNYKWRSAQDRHNLFRENQKYLFVIYRFQSVHVFTVMNFSLYYFLHVQNVLHAVGTFVTGVTGVIFSGL